MEPVRKVIRQCDIKWLPRLVARYLGKKPKRLEKAKVFGWWKEEIKVHERQRYVGLLNGHSSKIVE